MKSRFTSLITIVYTATFLAVAWDINVAEADDGCVNFDIPSVIPACELTTEDSIVNQQRLIEVIIPVSALVGCKDDQSVVEMMFRVQGLGTGIQVTDYSPRTKLYSDIEGSIAIEQRQERKGSVGLNAKASGIESVTIGAEAGTSKLNGESRQFHKIPEQKLLLASGTINRGNGVYFKFRHSPQTTLEGGHEIAITMLVPPTWRGGMLRIDCIASGNEKYLLGKSDFQAGSASFVVATYLKGDVDAQQTVQQYRSVEYRYRKAADAWQSQIAKKQQQNPIGQFLGYHESPLPADWNQRFMLLDSRSIRAKIKPHLPDGMKNATDQFLASRRGVLQLSR